jgi:hypothetical protein
LKAASLPSVLIALHPRPIFSSTLCTQPRLPKQTPPWTVLGPFFDYPTDSYLHCTMHSFTVSSCVHKAFKTPSRILQIPPELWSLTNSSKVPRGLGAPLVMPFCAKDSIVYDIQPPSQSFGTKQENEGKYKQTHTKKKSTHVAARLMCTI